MVEKSIIIEEEKEIEDQNNDEQKKVLIIQSNIKSNGSIKSVQPLKSKIN